MATGWPIDYPFEAIRDFDARGTLGAINLRRGDQGRVRGTDPALNNTLVQLPIDAEGNRGARGWVPTSDITIGTTRKVTDGVKIETEASETGNGDTRTIWVKTSGPGIANFRRNDFRTYIREREGGTKRMVISAMPYGHNQIWEATLANDESAPPEGTMLNVVFEIRTDGQPHSLPLAQLPTVGPFTDWDDALEVGMHIEWRASNGQLVQRRWQMDMEEDRAQDTSANDMQGYNIGTALRSFFMQEQRQLTGEFRGWLWDFGIARIKRAFYDHFTYTVRVHDLIQQRAVPGPQRKSPRMIAVELMGADVRREREQRDM